MRHLTPSALIFGFPRLFIGMIGVLKQMFMLVGHPFDFIDHPTDEIRSDVPLKINLAKIMPYMNGHWRPRYYFLEAIGQREQILSEPCPV